MTECFQNVTVDWVILTKYVLHYVLVIPHRHNPLSTLSTLDRRNFALNLSADREYFEKSLENIKFWIKMKRNEVKKKEPGLGDMTYEIIIPSPILQMSKLRPGKMRRCRQHHRVAETDLRPRSLAF